jgi:hypothetical protein
MPSALTKSVDAPGAHALHVRFLNHRHQRAFTTPPRLEQRRVVATIAHTRHAQFDAADARVPGAISITVAFAGPLNATFVLLRANVLSDLNLHQLLRQHTHPVAQEVHVTIQLGLAQQLVKRHPQTLGHRLWSPFSEISTIPMETIRWSFVSTT